MTSIKQKQFFIVLLGLIFVSMLILNFLTPLEADDYQYMFSFATGQRLTIIDQWVPSALAHYGSMNGRMVTNGIFSHMAAYMGKMVFNFFNAAAYLVFLLGAYKLARSENNYDWKLLLALHAAVFLFAPAFGSTVLWMIGACNYLWGGALLLWAMVPFQNAMVQKSYHPSRGKQVLFLLLGLMAGNVTENSSFAIIVLMVLCILARIKEKKTIPYWMIGTALLAIVGYAVLMLSPSTLNRVQPNPMGMGKYLTNFSICMAKLLDYSGLLCAYVFLALIAWRDKSARRRLYFSLGLFLCALLANLMMVIPGYYANRGAFGWVVFLLIACALLVPSLAVIRDIPLWNGVICCLVLLFIVTYLQALPPCYDRYKQAQARIADVISQKEKGVRDVVTFSIRSKTRFDVYYDGNLFSTSPSYGANRCFAKVYELDSFALSMEVH